MLIFFDREEKMSEVFEKYKSKKIYKALWRILNSKTKKKDGMKIFRQRIEKAWEDIIEIKSN
jgi:Mn-dependent DtxR family transcriptional regulator